MKYQWKDRNEIVVATAFTVEANEIEDVAGFLSSLTAAWQDIPSEFRQNAWIDISCDRDGSDLELTLDWWKPKSEEELEKQRAFNEERRRNQEIEAAQREMALFLALKAKYEPGET